MVVSVGELFRVARALREVALEAARDPGEEPATEGLVVVTDDLAHHDGATVGEVAARTGVAQSLVSKVVAELRDGGVVTTAPEEGDRRRTRIFLAPSTRAALLPERGGRSMDAALRLRFAELSDDELSQLQATLDQLAALIMRP